MPKTIIEFPEESGQFVPQWSQENYFLEVVLHHNEVLITGDAAGLRNLAA